jgi:hypothetical protein
MSKEILTSKREVVASLFIVERKLCLLQIEGLHLQPVAEEQSQGDQHRRTNIENYIFNHERDEAGYIIGIAYDAKHYRHGQYQCNQSDQGS